MKSIQPAMPLLLAGSLLYQTTVATLHATVHHAPVAVSYSAHALSETDSTIEKVAKLKQLMSSLKQEIYVSKQSSAASLQKFTKALIDGDFTVTQLQLLVQSNATKKEYELFQKLLFLAYTNAEKDKKLGSMAPQDLNVLVTSALKSTSSQGANFLGCSTGLGVGIPLVIVGVTIGVISLINATASKAVVTERYIQRRADVTTEYLNTIADLDLENKTFESDIIYYQDEIRELQRQINSGLYSTNDEELMRQDIRELEFQISDAVALQKEVKVDVDYYNSKYDADVKQLDQEELNGLARVDERKRNAGKQAIAAGIVTGLGAGFVAAGAKDCN